MSASATASNGTELIGLIEVSLEEIAKMVKDNGDVTGTPVYFADAVGPNGVVTFPSCGQGWGVDIWHHISLNPGPGDGRSSGAVGDNPWDVPYRE